MAVGGVPANGPAVTSGGPGGPPGGAVGGPGGPPSRGGPGGFRGRGGPPGRGGPGRGGFMDRGRWYSNFFFNIFWKFIIYCGSNIELKIYSQKVFTYTWKSLGYNTTAPLL